jgi:hypothetical protein
MGQFQGIPMYSMGESMTTRAGIGIAKTIAKHLHEAEDARIDREAKSALVQAGKEE